MIGGKWEARGDLQRVAVAANGRRPADPAVASYAPVSESARSVVGRRRRRRGETTCCFHCERKEGRKEVAVDRSSVRSFSRTLASSSHKEEETAAAAAGE